MTLSPRHKQIVTLLSQAKTNKIIAHELGLTEGTIRIYISHIFKKTGAANRTDLALMAVRQQL